jgi:SCP-2 sterol transfer family protein
MVVVSMSGPPDRIEVRLATGAVSGLASIMQQYLDQQLADCVASRARAARIRGRFALIATDYGAGVTVDFSIGEITIHDGTVEPIDARIAGPYAALTALIQGRTNPLIEHLRGRLRVSSSLWKPLLPLRLHRLMRLRPEQVRNGG